MSLDTTFNTLGQTVIPNIAAAVFPDTMNILGATVSAGPSGGRVKSATTTVYASVPVAYEPITQQDSRGTENDKMLSVKRYMLTFATHLSGSRINIDPKVHRLSVIARGNEPVKVFRIISVSDQMGVCFEAECEKEN
jgi:hypothetical protein